MHPGLRRTRLVVAFLFAPIVWSLFLFSCQTLFTQWNLITSKLPTSTLEMAQFAANQELLLAMFSVPLFTWGFGWILLRRGTRNWLAWSVLPAGIIALLSGLADAVTLWHAAPCAPNCPDDLIYAATSFATAFLYFALGGLFVRWSIGGSVQRPA